MRFFLKNKSTHTIAFSCMHNCLLGKVYVFFCKSFSLPKQKIMITETLNHINWLAVLVAGVSYFLLGAIWYTVLFGKKWQSYNATLMKDPDAKKGAGVTMIISFLLMVVCSAGLAVFAERFGIFGIIGGLKLGLLTGFCFAATALHISYLYEKRPLGLHLINGLYNVAGNVLAAMIICSWK